MYNNKICVFKFLILSLCFSIYACELAELHTQLNNIIANEEQAHIGVKVISLKNGNCLYQKDNAKLFTPASNLKLFTSAAALHFLGKDYTFKTTLGIDGIIKKEILKGNLYLKGSGDPSLTTQDLEELILLLKSKGISVIEGDLIIDSTLFDDIPFGPGKTWDDGSFPYNSPVSALNINHNCITIHISSDSDTSQASIKLEPFTEYVAIKNDSCIVESEFPSSLEVRRRWLTKENVIEVTGAMPKNTGVKTYRHTIENPALYTGTLLKELLRKHNISFNGTIIQDRQSKSVSIIACHNSAPLIQLLSLMLKDSDNLYADCIYKILGSNILGIPGTWAKGQEVVVRFLEQTLQIPRTSFNIVDGSGGSRYNLLSPNHIICLLQWLAQCPFYKEFIECLPIGGIDGTLKDRFIQKNLCSKIRAKTGNMGNVTALSGFMATIHGEPLAFSILIMAL